MRALTALIEAGADLDAPDNLYWTPLHHAACNFEDEAAGFAKGLLEAGADPNLRDKDGRTPLHEAALSPSGTACAEALTAAGADPTIQDKDGDTPFELSSGDSS